MALRYTTAALPPIWPGERTARPGRAKFKSQWTKTLELLERELRHLGARSVEIALELRGPRDLNQNGTLRADARPGNAVILSFITDEGKQAYPCDRFAWWQDNLYAIAIVLEDLRRAERYGVQSSLIRAGFKALPATTTPTMDAQKAAEAIHHFTQQSSAFLIMQQRDVARDQIRIARGKVHPDAGGSTSAFHLVQEAKRVLEAHHGVSL